MEPHHLIGRPRAPRRVTVIPPRNASSHRDDGSNEDPATLPRGSPHSAPLAIPHTLDAPQPEPNASALETSLTSDPTDATPGSFPRPNDPKLPGYARSPWLAPCSTLEAADGHSSLGRIRGPKRGPYSDMRLRNQTALTRKIGSCIRCTTQRIRVSPETDVEILTSQKNMCLICMPQCKTNPENPTGAFMTCHKLAGPSRFHFPCMRYKLTGLKLVLREHASSNYLSANRNCQGLISRQSIEPMPPKLLRISEGLSSSYMEVYVRRLVRNTPSADKQADHDNTNHCTESTEYLLADVNATVEAYANYIPRLTGSALKQFSGPPGGLLHLTYRMACQVYRDPQTPAASLGLLRMTFMLWTAVRLQTMPTFVMHQHSPEPEYPVSRILNDQLRLALMQYIHQSIRPDLVSKLQGMLCLNRRNEWLATYLAAFVLLHHLSLLMAHDRSEAARRGNTVCWLPFYKPTG